ncbi:MAG: nucleotide exchange factor GrpE [Ignavibacteriales bacterium]|nr:nucleotide exchange factor GrpE [Ignavibacteriales bacterium]
MNEQKDQEKNNKKEAREIEVKGPDTTEPVPQEKTSVDEIEKIKAELIQANQKNSELEKQTAELKDSLLRKLAEFENYKRRSENDQLNLLKYAAEPFIKNILTVYDDFERSLNHVNDDNSFESLKKGLELVYDKFTKILESQGVKKIDAKGKPFDVDLHEALMQQTADGVEPHTVLDVIEHGYMYKDKVIRHAKVIVSSETIQHDQNDKQNDSTQQG